MSYILDALRKADAERGASDSAMTGSPGAAEMPDAQVGAAPSIPFSLERRLLAWGVVLGVLIATIVAIRIMDTGPAQSAQADAVAWPAATTMTASATATASAAVAAASDPPVPAPAPVRAPAPVAPESGSAAGAAPATRPATRPATAKASAGASAPQRIFSREELPADIRATLPPLAVSGASYSANPAHRMLIVNGQVFQEGAQVAPQVVLEQIGPSAAVLRHRDHRLRISY